MQHLFGRRLAIGLALGAFVYLGMAIFADWRALLQSVSLLRWTTLVGVLVLSLANYGIRFVRWHFYLRRASVEVPGILSLKIFLCGLVMSVTPGKLGEIFKAYLVKLHTGTPVTRTGPVVIAERVTDLLALVVLLFAGSLVYRTGWLTLLGSGAVALGLVVALVSPQATRLVLHLVERVPRLRPYGERIERSYDHMRYLLRPSLLVQATALGALGWFAECLGFALVLHGLGITIGVARATFIYAFSTLVGAIALLPGGLGGTEATMIAFIMADGAAKPDAVACTFITRLATLWFAVLVGAFVLLGDRKLTVAQADLG